MNSILKSEASGRLIPLPLRKRSQNDLNRIPIPVKNKIEVLHYKEIVLLKANGNYTEIYLVSNEKILLSHTLKKFEIKLENEHFLRIHSGYIINQNYFRSYCLKTQTVTLTNQMQIPVSRSKRHIIKEFLDQISF